MSFPLSEQQITPGSAPPWPLIDFNTPLSCLLQDELPQPLSFMNSKSSSPSPTPPPLLLSPASMGASTTKVSKRKSRAASKPPIRVLSAEPATFRDIVQKLTGIPTSPSMQASRLWAAAGAGNSSGIPQLLAAQPVGAHSDLMPAAHRTMHTLDTSSPYLSRRYSSPDMAYNEVGISRFNGFYEASLDRSVRPALNFDVNGGGEGVMGGFYNEGGMAMDMESLRRLHRASELESLLMTGSNKLEDVLQSNKMGSWPSPDLMARPLSPKVEAHTA